MSQLNKDEWSIIIRYLDHITIKNLVQSFININTKQACLILGCVVEDLIEERKEIEEGIQSISDKIYDIDSLSEQIHDIMDNVE